MKQFKKILSLVIIALTIVFTGSLRTLLPVEASEPLKGKTQAFRAVWVSYYANDIPRYINEEYFIKQMNEVLERIESLGMNALVFHIRTHNNALYDSDLNPPASWWATVKYDQFDPLTWLISECHKRGIEFHAWLNPYRVLSENLTSAGYANLEALAQNFKNYPTNPASNANNLLSSSGGVIMDPGLPNVRQHVIDTCIEIINKYDVDAIHFDDYFYTSGVNDEATRNIYNTEALSIDDFRRRQIDILIEELHDEINSYNIENKRAVQLGISPSGIYRNGSYPADTIPQYDSKGNLTYPLNSNTSGFAHYGNYLYSDTKKWIDNEWIDYIIPQSYWAISHTSSSFTKLTEWWSWAVKYKKVNLYMGHGLYMAGESGGSATHWKNSVNEIYNQLDNMDNYDEIKGSCFYKYATFITNNAVVNAAVNVLKTNWHKKIPGAPIRTIDHLPVVKIVNVGIRDGVLSWDEVDNIRGYMVWKVPFNQNVDTTDINQLHIYQTNNSILIDPGYDYYVSSVNLANQISEPTKVNNYQDYENVINSTISSNAPITIDDISNLKKANDDYQKLSDSQKNLVFNYAQLTKYLDSVEKLQQLVEEIDDLIIPTNLENGQLLPLKYKEYFLTWQVDKPDLYNISSGEVTSSAVTTLKLTIEQDGYYYQKTYICQLIKNSDFEYDQVSYLNTMIENITPVAFYKEQYFEQMAYIYNLLETNEKAAINGYEAVLNQYQAFKTMILQKEPLINQLIEKVKNLADGSIYDYQQMVASLEKFCLMVLSNVSSENDFEQKYLELDNLINKFEKNDQYQIRIFNSRLQEVLSFIELYPRTQSQYSQTSLTKINVIRSEYQQKVMDVTDLSTLINITLECVDKLEAILTIEEEFTVYKNTIVENLNNLLNKNLYSIDKQNEIALIINDYIYQAEYCDTYAALDALAEDAIRRLNMVLTIEEEQALLASTINELTKQLLEYPEYSNYTSENKVIVEGYVSEYITKIEAATTIVDAEKNFHQAVVKIDAVEVIETLVNEKNEKTKALEVLVKDADITTEGKKLVEECLSKYKLQIKKASSIDEVKQIYDNAESEIKILIDRHQGKQGCANPGCTNQGFINSSAIYLLSFLSLLIVLKYKKDGK